MAAKPTLPDMKDLPFSITQAAATVAQHNALYVPHFVEYYLRGRFTENPVQFLMHQGVEYGRVDAMMKAVEKVDSFIEKAHEYMAKKKEEQEKEREREAFVAAKRAEAEARKKAPEGAAA